MTQSIGIFICILWW